MLSWSWGWPRRDGDMSRRRRRQGQLRDLSIMHRVDKASPALMKACATGEHIKEATVTRGRRAGASRSTSSSR